MGCPHGIRVRQFAVYPHTGEEFDDRLVATDGPINDGIWVRAQLVKNPPRKNPPQRNLFRENLRYKSNSYWETSRRLIPTSNAGESFRVEIRHGRLARDLRTKVMEALGGYAKD